ncbi:MAG: molybdopterin cofactor-binding domain-containing protein, partial [Mycobacteriales bacterium]
MSAAVGGGLAIGFASTPFGPAARAGTAAGAATVNTWIRIGADETITVLIGSSEMGQGVFTSLAQLVAEELEVDWSQVRAEAAPADPLFANPVTGAQLTGGSMSVRGYYVALRTAGAAARDMLRRAASLTFGVPIRRCVAAHGTVTVKGTASSATYGQLAALAATLRVPQHPRLSAPANFRIIGTPVARLDLPDKVRGAAVYGVDVRVPGMQHAIVVHA